MEILGRNKKKKKNPEESDNPWRSWLDEVNYCWPPLLCVCVCWQQVDKAVVCVVTPLFSHMVDIIRMNRQLSTVWNWCLVWSLSSLFEETVPWRCAQWGALFWVAKHYNILCLSLSTNTEITPDMSVDVHGARLFSAVCSDSCDFTLMLLSFPGIFFKPRALRETVFTPKTTCFLWMHRENTHILEVLYNVSHKFPAVSAACIYHVSAVNK